MTQMQKRRQKTKLAYAKKKKNIVLHQEDWQNTTTILL